MKMMNNITVTLITPTGEKPYFFGLVMEALSFLNDIYLSDRSEIHKYRFEKEGTFYINESLSINIRMLKYYPTMYNLIKRKEAHVSVIEKRNQITGILPNIKSIVVSDGTCFYEGMIIRGRYEMVEIITVFDSRTILYKHKGSTKICHCPYHEFKEIKDLFKLNESLKTQL